MANPTAAHSFPMASSMDVILKVNSLKTYFDTEDGVAKAVDGVDFQIRSGETLGVVGESGCGKSVTALSIMRLFPSPPGRIADGEIWFKGSNLVTLSKKKMRRIRGCEICMIFQEPMTSLNPVYTVGDQIIETVRLHQRLSSKEATDRAIEMLEVVGIAEPQRRIKEYPHQMSGGMRQRIMIAMALSCNPTLLIADEPTTALDVTIQAQILELMNDLKVKLGTAIMFITHDLGVVAETAQQVVVMYAGRVVEQADVVSLFENPIHPYTQGLIGSIPSEDAIKTKSRLIEIEGLVPSLTDLPNGCAFHPRCTNRMEKCTDNAPALFEPEKSHRVACWLSDGYDEPSVR
jgi:peptide/nickel transport system ATP-binding protein/oligopeptide transport system ATP-binding protein